MLFLTGIVVLETLQLQIVLTGVPPVHTTHAVAPVDAESKPVGA